MTSNESTEDKFIRAGRTAAALLTIAGSGEVDDDLDCLTRMTPLFVEMDAVDLAMTNVWLSKMLMQSLSEQYGTLDGAMSAVREMGLELAAMELDGTASPSEEPA